MLTETYFHHTIDPKEVAAIVVEPVQGEGGFIPPHPECLAVRAHPQPHDVRRHDRHTPSGERGAQLPCARRARQAAIQQRLESRRQHRYPRCTATMPPASA